MIELVKDFSNQLKHALKLAKACHVSLPEDDILNVVVVGMGGSGIGGDIVSSIVRDELDVPYTISRGYDLPGFVDDRTLVFCSSFSGNTEETISAYHQAKDKGATVCVITSGGQVESLAAENGDSILKLPGDISAPRANLGYSVVHLLYGLLKYELISDSFVLELENLVFLLENNRSLIMSKAKELATLIHGKLPVMYGSDRIEPALLRNAQQVNENGKQFCHINVFPELNHNEIVGWQFPESLFENMVFIFFVTDFDHARNRTRMKVCLDMLADKGIESTEIRAKGASFLEQVFYIINLFDFVSCELAVLNEVDPDSIDAINYLKAELSKS